VEYSLLRFMPNNAHTYQTISSPSTSMFKDRGSKHYGYAFPVSSKEEISALIKELRNKNPKANHVCHAWVLRNNGNPFEYSTDDGEPGNSAGPPILGQLKSLDLQNVLVAVVRYFGGTKLGVPGLINAYKTTAKLCLENSTVVSKEDSIQLNLRYDYSVYNEVMRIIKEHKLDIISQDNQVSCTMLVQVPLSMKPEIDQRIKSLKCNSVEWLN